MEKEVSLASCQGSSPLLVHGPAKGYLTPRIKLFVHLNSLDELLECHGFASSHLPEVPEREALVGTAWKREGINSSLNHTTY